MNDSIAKAIEIVGDQHLLAEKSGVSQAIISLQKNGHRKSMRFETAKALSNAVDGEITWQEFMQGHLDTKKTPPTPVKKQPLARPLRRHEQQPAQAAANF